MIHQDFNDLNEESTREEELVFGRTSRVMVWDPWLFMTDVLIRLNTLIYSILIFRQHFISFHLTKFNRFYINKTMPVFMFQQ